MNRRRRLVVPIMSVFAVELMDSSSAGGGSPKRYTDADTSADDDDATRQRRHAAITAAAEARPSTCVLSPRWRVLLASAVAAIGGILFGYDTGAP